MIRVGFLCDFDREWLGGVNYLKNLLFALQLMPDKKVKPIVFVGLEPDSVVLESFSPYAEIIKTSIMSKNSLAWWIWKISKKIFKTDFFLVLFLRKNKIDIFSHSNFFYCKGVGAVNWIPDFQHLHLPQLFDEAEIGSRNRLFRNLGKYSDLIILSSRNALNDFIKFMPENESKVRVLRFVAQPKRELLLDRTEYENAVLSKFMIQDRFFYIPNQFWKHKNHQVVFDALELLQAKGHSVQLVCSGRMSDYRDLNYFPEMKKKVESKNLQIKFLGIIDYDEVMVLMKRSIAVINPSYFEGWSSTVEECKVIGKNLILSDIGVHREQGAQGAIFFPPDKPDFLAKIILDYWNNSKLLPATSPMDLEKETLFFAKSYQSILEECFESCKKRRL